MENTAYPKQIQVIYAGKRQGYKEIFEEFFVWNNGLTDKKVTFGKIKNRFIIGGIYEITQKTEDVFVLLPDKYIKTDYSLALEYKTKHIAATEAEKRLKQIKMLLDKNPLIEQVTNPLKKIQKELTREQRKALLSYIIDLLTYNML